MSGAEKNLGPFSPLKIGKPRIRLTSFLKASDSTSKNVKTKNIIYTQLILGKLG